MRTGKRQRKPRPRFNVNRLVADMAQRGWNDSDLARAAGVSAMSVGRFLDGTHRTAKMADKLARPFGYTAARYFAGVAA